MIDIIPIQVERIVDKPQFCVEDIIATYCNWVGIDYELMFSQSWNFSYKEMIKSFEKQYFYRSLFIRENTQFDLLQKYHGLQINFRNTTDFYELIHIVKNEISKQNPIIVKFDAFYCPWDDFYQKLHNNHLCLAVGIEEEAIYLTDPYFLKKSERVPLQQFKLGCGYVGLFSKAPNKKEKEVYQKEDYKVIIRNKVNGLLEGNMFSHMQDFAMDFECLFHPSVALEREEHFFHTDFFMRLNHIIWDRCKYLYFLKYVQKQYEDVVPYEIVKKYHNLILYWKNILNMIAKTFYVSEHSAIRGRIAKKIQITSEMERELAETLWKCNFALNDIGKKDRRKIEHCEQTVRKIDICSYFNNKGIDAVITVDSKADLTGLSEYFLVEDTSIPDILFKYDALVDFCFLQNVGAEFDNISCLKQTIAIGTHGIFSELILSGCCEWGDFSDTMELEDETGKKESLTIGFRDLASLPNHEETVLLEGKTVQKEKEQANIKQKKAYLFLKTYSLPKLNLHSITLPYCPNMHLFSLSLR